ncbi:CopG family transcriptional regulator [Halostagnicola sp. A56]|uniref:double zinc ribbon domain-containing protein n=1 Tax=Halostagnicola sp. A56 TaxID=1495067 RepID=UPI0004A038A7|nr:zinc ribbon domain-containing protein [Halostagnicola sp. A56]KDE59962.1 CopG family transcriptional regulator [Halostagnicola sp. A56]
MSKITFRADDELIDELETFDASKSEVMRDALRTYLEGGSSAQSQDTITQAEPAREESARESIDEFVRERVDELLDERLAERKQREPQDVNVTVALENAPQTRKTEDVNDAVGNSVTQPHQSRRPGRTEPNSTDQQCGQCGESISGDHVYCPNCGEKASHRLFCECGDELRSDWGFCPGCGRRTAAADVLDSNGQHSRNS